MKKTILIPIAICIVLSLIIVIFFLMFPKKETVLIKTYAEKYSLSEAMVASVINIESGYDSNSVSKAGAVGLMQLLPSTAEECAKKLKIDLSLDNLFEKETNIMLGCYYLSYLLEMFDGNIINALSAYNWGLGNVKDWVALGNVDKEGTITNIPIEETTSYIKKYKTNLFIYKNIYRYS